MEIDKMSDKILLCNLTASTKLYHIVLRSEYIAKHILEEFGYYYEPNQYIEYCNWANALLEEAEERNLEIKLDIFSYQPHKSIMPVNINFILQSLKSQAMLKGEDTKTFDDALKYFHAHSEEILKEHQIEPKYLI